jgi:TonB dependent receptor
MSVAAPRLPTRVRPACYRRAVRRRHALLASLAGLFASPAAFADDPRDLFGLGPKPAAPPPSCDDGRTFGCETALDPFDEVSPYALRTWLPGRYLLRLPVADARHDTVASFALGASRDDAGPTFGGATGLENTWTIEGAPVESLRNGNVETRVPLAFLDTLLVTAGGFAARDRTSSGGVIEARLLRGGDRHEQAANAWVTFFTEADRKRPIPRASFQLRRIEFLPRQDLSAAVVGTGPLPRLLGGKAWYAAGIAPTLGLTDVRWRAARLVDLDADGIPDGFPGLVVVQPITEETEGVTDYSIPVMARAGWRRGPHELELTLLGTAAGDSVYFANATRQAAGVDRQTWTGDLIASWRGSWRDTRVRGVLSWHRSTRHDSAHDPAAAGIPQLQTAYVPTTIPEDPLLAELCDDANPEDQWPGVPNCPVPFGFFLSGGAGLLTETVADRPVVSVDAAHRRGSHILRAGGVFDDARLVNRSRFTGGELVSSLFEGFVSHQRFFRGSCPEDPAAMPCDYIPESQITYRTRYVAAYAEDTFQLAPNIRANGGLRWELMWIGPYLHQSKQFAPRLGVAWDVIGDGSSRLFAGMGRSFIMLPAGTGTTVIARPATVRDVEFQGELFRNTDLGGIYPPVAGIQPAAQDEATVGFEIGRPRTARAAVWLQARSLRRAYETVVVNPETLELGFDNPGRHPGETPARRDTTQLAVEISTDPAARTVVRASYLYGRVIGSWTGPVDPRQGQTAYAGDDWDLDSANYIGPLPTDPGHRVFVEGERRGRLGSVDLGVAARLTVGSGRPRNVIADTGLGIIYLLPRGSAGRAPAVSQANVRVSARWHRFDLSLEVSNLFDRQTATSFDEIYAGGAVRPIIGGTEADLVFLRTEDGDLPERRPAYRLPAAFQAPIAATLGIHRAF